MHGDAVKPEGKAPSKEDEMAMSPWVLTRPFRCWGFDSSHWLFSQCFPAPSPNTVERSQSINGHQSRKRNFGRQSSISCVCERRVKKDKTLVEKSWSNLSQLRAAEHPMQRVKKQRTGLLHRHPVERNSSSIKAKGRQCRSTGFSRDFGSIVAGTKPSGRTLDLYIYIYRQWRKSKSTRNCGARWGSPQLSTWSMLGAERNSGVPRPCHEYVGRRVATLSYQVRQSPIEDECRWSHPTCGSDKKNELYSVVMNFLRCRL